jgi:hypothetical protein
MNPQEQVRVAFAEEQKLDWLALKDTPGFGGIDIPGVQCKFFGKPERGPWFYMVKHEPGTEIPRHKHRGDTFHFIVEGEWRWGRPDGRKFEAGFMQFEQEGLYYGPFWSGAEGSVFLAIYDAEPLFIEADDEDIGSLTPTYG